jgi:hypothetical protein
MKTIKFKHKSGTILIGQVQSSFIYKKTNQEYFLVVVDKKKYSVNPKNIIEEIVNN